jgi:hypothetical protein
LPGDRASPILVRFSLPLKEPVMKPKSLFWLLTSLILFGGCLPSLNAVFTDEDLVFDPSVVGVWTQPGAKAKWDFAQRDEKSYALVYTDNDGRQGRFVGHLAAIEGLLFLDLYPEKIEADANPFYSFHLAPLHTIYLVRQTEPRLQLAVIDYSWLDEFLAKHPDAIQHAVFNGRKLITAPTEDVQAFVVEHADAFRVEFKLERALATVN